MTTKHTPGEWTYACDSYHYTPCLGKVRHSKKAVVYSRNPAVTIASHVANWDDARLIVAAPELYEALRTLYLETADYIKRNNLGDVHHNRSMQMASDALKKATGLPTTL